MQLRRVISAAALVGLSSSAGALTVRAQAGGCTPGATQGDLSQTVGGLVQSVQAPDQARGTIDTIAEAVRQNNVQVVCVNDPSNPNTVVDALVQAQIQALDLFSGVVANDPNVSAFLAQNNIDPTRVVIVGADTAVRPMLLYVWNRR